MVVGSSPLNASTESATTVTNYAGPGPAAGSGAHRSVATVSWSLPSHLSLTADSLVMLFCSTRNHQPSPPLTVSKILVPRLRSSSSVITSRSVEVPRLHHLHLDTEFYHRTVASVPLLLPPTSPSRKVPRPSPSLPPLPSLALLWPPSLPPPAHPPVLVRLLVRLPLLLLAATRTAPSPPRSSPSKSFSSLWPSASSSVKGYHDCFWIIIPFITSLCL